MNQTIIEQSALPTDAEEPHTGLTLINKDRSFQSKLVALWRLDEHSKLYCQWVKKKQNEQS